VVDADKAEAGHCTTEHWKISDTPATYTPQSLLVSQSRSKLVQVTSAVPNDDMDATLQPGDVDYRPATPVKTGVKNLVDWHRDYYGV
jgi:hypothetical protein